MTICGNDRARPRDEIYDSLAWRMKTYSHQFEVFWPIVLTVAILVMDMFVWLQWSAE